MSGDAATSAPPGAGRGFGAPGLLAEWLAVGGTLSAIVIGLVMSGAVQRFDHILYDLVLVADPPPPPAGILVIGIDEASLARLGPWPWPRRIHAAAIDRLRAAGVRAISYDVLFTEPRRSDGGLDAALARAATAGVKIVLPMQFRVPGSDGLGYDEVPPVVGRGSASFGHSSVRRDNDGVVRSLELALDGTRRWPHVAALVAGVPPLPAFTPRSATQPLRREGERLIGLRGGAGAFPTLPFAALLAGEVPDEVLAGRMVLVGVTAAGLGDQFATPSAGASGLMPGVELQASFVADLIEGRNLRRAGPFAAAALALAALWLGMLALLRLRPVAAALAGVLLMAAVAAAAIGLFVATGLWVGPAAALAGLLLAQPIWAWRRLAAVNAWMMGELADLGQARGRIPAAVRAAPADPVTRTTQLLEAAIDRVDNLRELADAAVRGLPDATLLVDRDGGIVAANTAAEALFGAAPSLADVDAAFAGATGLPPFAGATGLPPFGAAALADPQSAWRGEQRSRDGSVRDVRFTPWRDKAGAALGWIVRFADITALRRAEQAREEALQLLTHDMRAPQATILALLDREQGLDPELAARLRHLAERTIGLADGYLQLARADAGSYAMSEVDLAAIVTEAVDELWPQSQAKGVRLVAAGLDDEALLGGNHQLLLRAAVNLIGNAVRFAPDGSKVDVMVAVDRAGWRFSVKDHGPGITAEAQARLFGRFRAGPEDTGIGLGLAFVRAVAEGHGGSVACVSAPGAGATFTMRLPVSGAPPADRAPR